MDFIYYLAGFVFFILLGLFAGGYNERRHLRKLDRREKALCHMPVTQVKSFPAFAGGKRPAMVIGEVVITTDYLKNFLAAIRNIFGGRVKSYQSLLVRARREATLRVMEKARSQGYNALCNVRLETADVGGSTSSRKVAMVAIIASGTAYRTEQGGQQPPGPPDDDVS